MLEKEIKRNVAIVRVLAFVVFAAAIIFTLVQRPKLPEKMKDYFREVSFKTFGGRSADSGWNVLNAGDGYVVSGDTASYGQGKTDVYLLKTDLAGNLAWTRTFGGQGTESGIGLCGTGDGGFLIAGGTNSSGNGEDDVYAVRADRDGESVWEKSYGGTNYDYSYSACRAGDSSGYVITGYTSSFGSGNDSDVYLMKIDEKGKKLWEKQFGSKGWDVGYSVAAVNDGGYIIAGYTASFGSGKTDIYLIKTDSDGNCRWARTYGGIRDDRATSVIQAKDGGFIVAGKSQSYVSRGFGWDIILMKIDPEGNSLWTKIFPAAETEVGNCVAETKDHGFIIAGATKCYGICDSDVLVIRADAEGNTKWMRIFSGRHDDYANSVCLAGGGGYVIAGTTLSYGQGNGDIFLMKVGEDGEKVW
jgi:hypothetical protein